MFTMYVISLMLMLMNYFICIGRNLEHIFVLPTKICDVWIYGHICIHMHTHGGPRASPWPKTGGPAAAMPAGPAGRAAAEPPVSGQGLVLGPSCVSMYTYAYVCICVHM